MIRLTRLADYAIVSMCEMAAKKGRAFSARCLSEKTGISETATMKVLKLLAKAGVIDSIRGAKGGYVVENTPGKISILDVVKAVDGPVAVTMCTETSHDNCELKSSCMAKSGWNRVNRAMQDTLAKFTIADFLKEYSSPLRGEQAFASPKDVANAVGVASPKARELAQIHK